VIGEEIYEGLNVDNGLRRFMVARAELGFVVWRGQILVLIY